MPKDFAIVTDSSCDLPLDMVREMDLSVVPLQVNLNGDCFEDTDPSISLHEFYQKMREGAVPTTSAPGAQRFMDAMLPVLESRRDVLVMSFSGALSGASNAARLAVEEMKERFPDLGIAHVDTLCASMGQGLLITRAHAQKMLGKNMQQVKDYVEQQKKHLCHLFTVDDLSYLRRGGRISPATAALGTLLGIKPLMHMDDEGCLVSYGKVRGRKAALRAMAEKLRETATEPFGDREAFISHCDCEEDALSLSKMIRELAGVKKVIIGNVGPVIGSHAGPGTLALFFMAAAR